MERWHGRGFHSQVRLDFFLSSSWFKLWLCSLFQPKFLISQISYPLKFMLFCFLLLVSFQGPDYGRPLHSGCCSVWLQVLFSQNSKFNYKMNVKDPWAVPPWQVWHLVPVSPGEVQCITPVPLYRLSFPGKDNNCIVDKSLHNTLFFRSSMSWSLLLPLFTIMAWQTWLSTGESLLSIWSNDNLLRLTKAGQCSVNETEHPAAVAI